jgi:hypothetical protein
MDENSMTTDMMADQPEIVEDFDVSDFNSDIATLSGDADKGSQRAADAFDDADDTEYSESDKDAQNATEGATEGEAEEKPADQQEQAEQRPDEAKPEEMRTLKVKYLGEEKELTEEEAVTLAQKGMDYDRQRQKAETLTQELDSMRSRLGQLAEYEAFLKELAEPQALTVEDLMLETRATVLAKQQGIDMETALARVKARQAERAAARAQAKPVEADPVKEAEARRQRDVEAFLKEYGHVKPDEIPPEVWKKVGEGTPLVDAYRAHEVATIKAENQRLKAEMEAAAKRHKEELEAERRNWENAKRSTGSQATAGGKKEIDPFLEDWYKD